MCMSAGHAERNSEPRSHELPSLRPEGKRLAANGSAGERGWHATAVGQSAKHLEVLPHLQANFLGRAQSVGISDARHKKAARHRQVEGVKGCLVGDYAHVSRQRVPAQVHLRITSSLNSGVGFVADSDGVQQAADGCDPMEEEIAFSHLYKRQAVWMWLVAEQATAW